jgi:hypothetical protein
MLTSEKKSIKRYEEVNVEDSWAEEADIYRKFTKGPTKEIDEDDSFKMKPITGLRIADKDKGFSNQSALIK